MHHVPQRMNPDPTNPGPRRLHVATGVLVLTLLVSVGVAAPASAAVDEPCREMDVNVQCSEFGTIRMASRTDVRGEPVQVDVNLTLDTAYQASGARWVLFSVRHTPESGQSPVILSLERFATPHGDIITTEREQNGPNEVNLWVHVMDVPVGVPVELSVKVGVVDRGAFSLEALVMAFDRGYEPIYGSDGEEASLFSFTLLGVNQETRAIQPGDDRTFLDGKKTPALSLPVLALALVAVAAAVSRRGA